MTFFIENIEVFGVKQALANEASGGAICYAEKSQQNQRSKSSKSNNPYGGVSLLARTSRLGLAALCDRLVSQEIGQVADGKLHGQVVDEVGQIALAVNLGLLTLKSGV